MEILQQATSATSYASLLEQSVITVEFYHYTRQPVTSVYSVDQDGNGPGVYKPRGLWLSAEDQSLPENDQQSWANWCNDENFSIGNLRHRVHLRAGANILWLKCGIDFDVFTMNWRNENSYNFHCPIRWADVAKHYSGIIIAPYQWSRRMTDHTFWYYGWDCASGCIWDKNAVAYVEVYT